MALRRLGCPGCSLSLSLVSIQVKWFVFLFLPKGTCVSINIPRLFLEKENSLIWYNLYLYQLLLSIIKIIKSDYFIRTLMKIKFRISFEKRSRTEASQFCYLIRPKNKSTLMEISLNIFLIIVNVIEKRNNKLQFTTIKTNILIKK